MKIILSAAVLAAATLAVSAGAATVTPTNPQGWTLANQRGTGTGAIDTTYTPAGETGSLHFTTAGAGDKADFVYSLGLSAGRTLGSLTGLSYDIYRDGTSTANADLAPAFRLAFYDQPTGKTGYLIYEPTYTTGARNAAVATDQWLTKDILGGNFWMREFGPSATIEKYDVTLAQWASGTSQAPGAYVLSASTYIYSIEVGVGSGWGGSFKGAVDNVRVAFGSDVVAANFELDPAAAVPEPATWAMMVSGFGLVGAALRRRRAGAVAIVR